MDGVIPSSARRSITGLCCMAEANPIVLQWVAKAEGDWVALLMLCENSATADAAVFHAQQCLEKYLKAALIAAGVTVRKTHDLLQLSSQLASIESGWRPDDGLLDVLNEGGVGFRYPGQEATVDDAARAVQLTGDFRRELRRLLLGDD